MERADLDEMEEDSKGPAEEEVPEGLEELLKTDFTEEAQVLKRDMHGFLRMYQRFLQEKRPSIQWEKIQQPLQDRIQAYNALQSRPLPEDISSLLNQLVVLKLNGGLGTSLGCQGPKSLISVRNGNTFLDLTVKQIEHLNQQYDCDVPLLLMNSFYTDEDTQYICKKYSHRRVRIQTFTQSRFPRINSESRLPLARSLSIDSGNAKAWYPPGHGDVYASLYRSGLLQQFLSQGKHFIFISNIDNLGATVDLHILGHLVRSTAEGQPCEFLMEVTDKTQADVKGGTLIQYEGSLRLLEIAQVPAEHIDEFTSVSKFKIFNTNNLWVSLEAIKRLQSKGEDMDLEIIANQKTLDGGLNILQLETAVGAAIKNFQNVLGVNVPRRRFLPVKTTSDLLLVMSNLYSLRDGCLVMNKCREFQTVPLIKLGDGFTKVQDFLHRFQGIPNLLELDHLTVSGDVIFGKNVTLKGTVIVIANCGECINIPTGSVLENKIVSGNLRIHNH
ncbi:UTP--glucose-1-phosphate uridylyltransferase-like isoform X2 [Rhinatrema bivittatum]|uniref:UTP--glucose-1-phosphate uridylyltransferase-like isoform X2 n=1 Tax=Rhinatrema bivittatum TaxID=194408 RepID=UPI0011266BBA|nr:UTP--glucose-1-phosphate uridylyltransferase-like isoform X2 [Rhinatrema bivittatum]